jgi:hypothetical protein
VVHHPQLPWPFQVSLDTCAQQNSSRVAKELVQKQLNVRITVSARITTCT